MPDVIILNDTSVENHHGCTLVMTNLYAILEKLNYSVSARSFVGDNWLENKKFCKNVNKADLVIVNGEGTIHHGKKPGLRLLKIAEFVSDKNIPCFLINTTYQANPKSYKHYLSKYEIISVRESYSQKELGILGIESLLVPDLSFFTSKESFELNRKYIGVTDSVYEDLSRELYLFANKNGFKYLPIIEKTLLDFFRPIKTIRRVISRNDSLLTILNKMNLYFLRRKCRTRSSKEYIKSLQECKLVITGRFHTMCLCILTETPFIALKSNSHKMESLIIDVGIDQDRIKTLSELENFGENKFEQYSTFTKSEQVKIQRYLNYSKDKIEELFEKINMSL